MWAKFDYFLSSLKKRLVGTRNSCPNCKTNLSIAEIVDRKYMVTTLVECPACKILVRVPTDSPEESKLFYQDSYSQGYTTDCPNDEDLAKLLRNNFVGTERDYSRYIRFFDFLGISKDKRILDFGCSWGYGLFQLTKEGFKAEGFEVSSSRSQYGKTKLGMSIHSSREELVGTYDIIFSSHVLEHLPDFTLINHLYRHQLSKGGYFIAVTPNGSRAFIDKSFDSFHQLWGRAHPVLLSDRFVAHNYRDDLCYITSWDSMNPEFIVDPSNSKLDKYELVFVLKKGK